MNRYIFTCGDPNGIGPEIVLKTLNKVFNSKDEFLFIIPKDIFLENSKYTKTQFPFKFYSAINYESDNNKHVKIICVSGSRISTRGATKLSGKISYSALRIACKLADEYKQSAIITAPISKYAWDLNEIKFKGHTDFLGDYYKVRSPLMLFYSKKLITALSTIHIPLKSVSNQITTKNLIQNIQSLLSSLKIDFNIPNPSIAVLGLNPHAGENGNIGNEEVTVIDVAIKSFKNGVHGTFVPDAFFGKKLYKKYDAVLGMYHDQVLIPFKMLDFEKGVNFTANLPIVRTSPDHGTAFDIAYQGKGNPKSMIESFSLAKKVLKNRQFK